MGLKTLKPRLQAHTSSRLAALKTQTPVQKARTRGRAWMEIRKQVFTRDQGACAVCGRVSLSNEVDHEIALMHGGTDDLSNLRLLCQEHHREKSAQELRKKRSD